MKYEGVVLYVGLATEGLANKLVLDDCESYSEEATKLWGERHAILVMHCYSHYGRSILDIWSLVYQRGKTFT